MKTCPSSCVIVRPNWIVSHSFCFAFHFFYLFLQQKQTGGAQHFLANSGVTPDKEVAQAAKEGMSAMIHAGKKLTVATWNIAAINNNPFEYWITYKENPKYEELMVKVESFLEHPGDKDVPVSTVFTENMFSQLDTRLKQVGWTSVRNYWDEDFKNRKIVDGFMKVQKFN